MKSNKELEDDYHWWITCIPDNLDFLESILPSELYQTLDYSIDSLGKLGEYLVDNFTNESLMSNIQNWDAFASYVGVVYEKNVPTAKWRVELEDDKNLYFGVPALRTKGNTNFYPKYEITAMIDRKRSDFLLAITKRHIALQTPA
jgi:hypothetical protein